MACWRVCRRLWKWWIPRGHGLGLEARRGHFIKSLALDVKSLALVLMDLESLTIDCRIITLLFVIIQWNRIETLNKKLFHLAYIVTYLDQVQVLLKYYN